MEPLLAMYVANPEDDEPRVAPLSGGRMGYVAPIYVQPMCLACHGSDLAGPVAARIRELYPEDRATGFAMGDFRGMFWAELPAGGTAPVD